MVDIFLVVFFVFIIFGSGIILGIYKLMSWLLKKTPFKDKGISIMRVFISIVSIAFFIINLRIGVWLYENPRITDPDYNRAIYSVIIYNSTDTEIDGLEICAGDNRILAQTVDDIQPREYRKINIPTHKSEFIDSIAPPYDVYVRKKGDLSTEICVGYFGIDTGGTEVVSVLLNNKNNIVLEKEAHSSKKYDKVYRLDRKDQDLVSWYD